MKAIEVTKHGGPEVLQLVERPRPQPGAGQVLIEVKAAGINFADLMGREGTYPAAPPPPYIPGMEAAGIVSELGPGVSHLALGQRVASFVSSGYAEFALAEAAQAVPIPDSLDDASATALLVQGLTAYFLLTSAGELTTGKSVEITAAAGGVGSLAVQIAKLLGAGTVIGLASTDEKRAIVTSLGADHAVDYTRPGWSEKVRGLTEGRGVDLYIDATGDTAGEGPSTLAPGGFWVIYGSQTGRGDGLTGKQFGELIFGGRTIRGFTLYSVLSNSTAIANALHELLGWTAAGKLKIDTGHRFPLAEAAAAHAAIAARQTTGKVVLEP